MSERSLQPVLPLPGISTNLADRLRRERHRAFVGRHSELALLKAALDDPKCTLLFLSGQAGSGKTSVLLEYERLCLLENCSVAYCDGARLSLLAAEDRKELQSQLLGQFGERGHSRSGPRPVLLVDAYERLGTTEPWLLGHVVPELRGDTLLVFASRHAPPLQLALDPAWSRLMRCHELTPWSEAEAQEFLGSHGIPAAEQANLIELGAGYPLALAIATEVWKKSSSPQSGPRFLRELQGLLGQVLLPTAVSPAQQVALDVCALARTTTPELLDHVLRANPPNDQAEAVGLYAWLANQPFVERGPMGLSPHALARLALLARVRRERPQNYRAVYRPVREFCIEQLAAGSGTELGFADLFFLDRDVPFVQELAQTNDEQPESPLEVASTSDQVGIVELIRELEGDQSAELAKARLREDLRSFELTRSGSIDAVMQFTTLTDHTDVKLVGRDPAAALAKQFVLDHPLEKGAQALFFRWFLSRDDYQSPRARVLTIAARQAQLVMSNQRAAYSLCVFRSPDEWLKLWESASVPTQLVGRFVVGKHEYSLMAFFYSDHSLRDLLVDAWQGPVPVPVTAQSTSWPEEQTQKIRQRAAELGRNMPLTPRELQILELLCLGETFEEIAAQLQIRPRTVKFHQENLLRKTGSSSRVELFRKLI